MNLSRRRLLIAGASSGLGRELARQLAERQCRLFLFSRTIHALREAPELAPFQDALTFIEGDIHDAETVAGLPGKIQAESGGLDGLIVTIGVSRPDLIEHPDLARSLDTLRTNLEGPVRLIYTLLPLLLPNPGSFLAACTSMAGDRGMPRGHTYSAAKAGLDRFLESLRIDLLDRNVKVFTIVPGYVDTPMSAQNVFPMPGIWPLARGARHVIDRLEAEIPVIRFPWYHSLGMRLLTMLPGRLYWWLMNRQRTQVKIRPQARDSFTWPVDC